MDARRMVGRLKVGRFFDWVWFTIARVRASGSITSDGLPYCEFPCRLEVKRGASLHIGAGVKFRSGFRAYVERGARVEIGARVLFSGNNWLAAIERITIGDECMFGPRATVVDADHVFGDVHIPISRQGARPVPVDIGEDTWLGAGVVVVKSSIGAHSVVGANAVVTKPIPPATVAVGIPARVVKSRTS